MQNSEISLFIGLFITAFFFYRFVWPHVLKELQIVRIKNIKSILILQRMLKQRSYEYEQINIKYFEALGKKTYWQQYAEEIFQQKKIEIEEKYKLEIQLLRNEYQCILKTIKMNNKTSYINNIMNLFGKYVQNHSIDLKYKKLLSK